VRAGWLSLDEDDNHLPRLLTHLAAALSRIGLDIEATTLALQPTASMSATLTALVNDVARAGQEAPGGQWILVLDDYHVVQAPEVHEAMTFLLDHLPEALRLVVATRTDPPFPLALLRGRGQLTEVRAHDLRFTPQEAREFLNRLMGLNLTAAEVDALDERTEGWIARASPDTGPGGCWAGRSPGASSASPSSRRSPARRRTGQDDDRCVVFPRGCAVRRTLVSNCWTDCGGPPLAGGLV
jgi:hypothetical protein